MERDTVKDAWLKGIKAAAGKLAASENPYAKGTMLHETWLMGWRRGAGLSTNRPRRVQVAGEQESAA